MENMESMKFKPSILRTPSLAHKLTSSGTMIEAGSETTSQTLNNTIVGLLSNPEAVKQCQEELDRVIGDGRTPTFDDEPNLPYIRALGKETLRWRPTNKLGANHYVTQDDWYEGYFIPKDTIIMINQWALGYNEEDHPEPEKATPSHAKLLMIVRPRTVCPP